MVYCQFAAAPVGRYLIDILGEDPAVCGRASDALCAALRILRRLRDFRDPTVDSDRPCIPLQFLTDAKVTDFHLSAPKAKGQTRAVIDRVLDGVDRLLRDAKPLPGAKESRSEGVFQDSAVPRDQAGGKIPRARSTANPRRPQRLGPADLHDLRGHRRRPRPALSFARGSPFNRGPKAIFSGEISASIIASDQRREPGTR